MSEPQSGPEPLGRVPAPQIQPVRLSGQCLAEWTGTFILVFFGVGSVHAAVATGAQAGIWQVAVVWGVAISLAIYATAALSGTHINPAITIALAAFGGFPVRKVLPYVLAQLAGASAAAGVLYLLFNPFITAFEREKQVTRGAPGSEISAMMYGEYFPNPAVVGTDAAAYAKVSRTVAALAEGLGTAFLAFFVFALVDVQNPDRPGGNLAPWFIGLTISILISVIAPLTQAGFNPARDFGPRLVAYCAGWGRVAIPGPRGGFFDVYILAPIIGALAGAGFYQKILRPFRTPRPLG